MTTSTSQPSTRRRQRSARTRDRVLAVATELMARHGYTGTTISAISKASGVMPASIYWHFESKEGLLAAVIERAAEAWFDGAKRVMGDPPMPSEEGDHRGLAYIFEERPDFYRVLMLIGLERGQAGGPPLEAVRRVRARLRERLTQRLGDAMAAEGLDDPGLAERLAGFAMVLLDGLFVAQQIDPVEGEALLARYDMLPETLRAVRTAMTAAAGGGEDGS